MLHVRLIQFSTTMRSSLLLSSRWSSSGARWTWSGRRPVTVAAAPNLSDWVLGNGGASSGVEIIRSPDAGYGLVASSQLDQGQKLVQLPLKCQLTFDDATDPRLLALISQVPKELWGAKLALQLISHRVAAEDSIFATYISQLPLGINVPQFFPASGQAAIHYPPVGEQVKKRCRWLHEFSTKVLSGLPGTPADPFDGVLVDMNALGWALACVTSRAFRVRGPSQPAAMLPLIDMCNHSFDPNCVVLPVDGQNGAVAMFAKRKILPGEPLLLSYGPLSNDFLFMDYGFIIPDNVHDRVTLRFDVDLLEAGAELGKARGPDGGPLEQLTLTLWKKQWLQSQRLLGPDSNLEVALGGPQLCDPRLLGAVRVMLAANEGEIKERTPARLGDLSTPLSRASETASLRIVMGLALLALANFPTTLEHDLALLAGQQPPAAAAGALTAVSELPLSPDMRLAVSFRAGKKRLLTGVVQALAKRIQELKTDVTLPHTTTPAAMQKGQTPIAATKKGFGSKKP